MSVVQCHKAIFFLMRIIAVWSLFARWNHSVTESDGCSPHGLKNTSWPSGSLEIFSAERQRISRSGTFIATSEHTLNSAYNRHESRARRSPLRWHWTAGIRKWLSVKGCDATPGQSKYVIAGVHGACGMIAGNHFLASVGAWLNAEWRGGSNPNQERAWRTRTDDESPVRRHPCRILTGHWGSRCSARSISRYAVNGCQWTTAHRHRLTAYRWQHELPRLSEFSQWEFCIRFYAYCIPTFLSPNCISVKIIVCNPMDYFDYYWQKFLLARFLQRLYRLYSLPYWESLA